MVGPITEKMKELKKKKLIKDFKEKGKVEAWSCREYLEDGASYRTIYGLPVGDDKGNLQGFNMTAEERYYEVYGYEGRSAPHPYEVSKGKSFLSVDEYVQFIAKRERAYWIEDIINQEDLGKEAVDSMLSEGSKLADVRKKIARTSDKILGTNMESKKVKKSFALAEKIISDAVFGKKRD